MLELEESAELIFVNSLCKKKDQPLVTYDCGGHKSQIEKVRSQNCEVIPGESYATEHR